MTEKKRKNLPWTEDEYRLALIVYQDIKRCGEKISASNPKVVALSQLLQVLDIYPKSERGENFREPDGVRSRISYFKRMDDGESYSDREMQFQVWKKYYKSGL
ncbi:hypothetical protein NRZ30_19525 [Aeromonas jandaei]|uniref:hypothetical protein n=1 Tax=Aeromonas jandaei TaxID=650 RepID=UPI00227B1EB9|nr:hypothetical protein [Aeromonas jandaei]WAG07195.1 hypothetical protein NRZ30_19525 [Aeromonas jandaei]